MNRTVLALLVSLVFHAGLIASLRVPDQTATTHQRSLHMRITAPVLVSQIPTSRESDSNPGVALSGGSESDSGRPGVEEAAATEAVEPGSPDIAGTVAEPAGSTEGQGDDIGFDGGSGGATDAGSGGEGPVAGSGSGEGDEVGTGEPEPGSSGGGAAAGVSDEGPDIAAIRERYSRTVLAAVTAHREYPASARRLAQEGEVRVGFQVSGDGSVSSIRIESSSGFESLDEAACDAVRNASPVPPIPPELGVDELTLTLLIVFVLD